MPAPCISFDEMRGALNLVEILASAYLLAIIGALAYASLQAFLAKRDTMQALFTSRHQGHRGASNPPHHAHIR